ncbi:MAG: hypothetical protein KF729_23725 [Sandaracinaceae bacterium]|nr:hypothetical protein [Sandaracinaceae bacterium]
MTTRRIPALILAAAAAAYAAGAGCAAPVLPLPPPTALIEGPPDAEGVVTIRGEARPGALVFCFNEETERGVIETAGATGAYVVRIAASSGDVLTVWQQQGTQSGMLRSVTVP